MHVNGLPRRACVTPIEAVANGEVTTIEGIAGPEANAIRHAWQAIDVPQCGYCQAGQMMSAIALLRAQPTPSDDDIDLARKMCWLTDVPLFPLVGSHRFVELMPRALVPLWGSLSHSFSASMTQANAWRCG